MVSGIKWPVATGLWTRRALLAAVGAGGVVAGVDGYLTGGYYQTGGHSWWPLVVAIGVLAASVLGATVALCVWFEDGGQ